MTIWYARNDVPYSGGDAFISITFPYIKKEHIKVFVNDTETINYVYNNETQIKINDVLQAGDVMSVRRNTPIDEKMVVFSDTSILNKDTQNLAQDQVFNVVQEMYDILTDNKQDTDNQIADFKDDIDTQIETNKQDTDNQIASFEAAINATLEEVTEAAEKINELEEAVETATTSAEDAESAAILAAQEATKAINKANELTDSLNLLNSTSSALTQEISDREAADTEIENELDEIETALQAQINDLMFISNKVYCDYLNFLKAGTSHTDLQILPNTAIQFKLGTTTYFFKTETGISFNAVSKLDSGDSLQNGKDYSVYIVPISTGYDFVVSLNSTYPTGYTADTAYKIGGFHTLCVGVTSSNAPTLPSDSFFTAHPAIGYNAGDIIPNSIWCLTHRPISDPDGMVYVDLINKWVDIYLQSGTFKATASVYGASTTDSRQPILHQFDMLCVFKTMATDNEFMAFAEGSNQLTAIAGAADAVTTGGHLDTAGKRMISCYFIEDCCGFLWQWLDEIGFNGQGNWTSYGTGATSRGQTYGMPYVLLAGGDWGLSSSCGSWSRVCDAVRSDVRATVGCRGVSRPLLIGKMA